MSAKNLLFVLTCHQGYIRHVEDENAHVAENDILFTSISSTYLPLLRLFERLERDAVPVTISLVISPIVTSLLADPVVQQQYIEWLDRHILLGERECARCAQDKKRSVLAQRYLAGFQSDKYDFCEKYTQNLLREFARFAKKGLVELLATAGSYAFLPHYADMTEILNAQVETGLYAHRACFGTMPEGFWLPHLGYAQGVENVLRAYGINYTFVDTHAVLFGDVPAENGIFTPVRTQNSLVLFARDTETPNDICGENGFCKAPVYKEMHKDIGFDLSKEALGEFLLPGDIRVASGYQYWSHAGEDYDVEAAQAQVQADADAFVEQKKAKLEKAASLLTDKDVSLACTIPVDAVVAEWAEGIDFLEAVIRKSARELSVVSASSLLQGQFSLQRITAYPSAASGTGYGEDLLDSSNGWMLRYTRKMCERMIDLVGRFPAETGLRARLLNLAAKELLIAQGSEWPKMMHDNHDTEYVAEHFKASIKAFITVFDALGSNTVSTEWLTRMEREHSLFPWMNYRIFARKK